MLKVTLHDYSHPNRGVTLQKDAICNFSSTCACVVRIPHWTGEDEKTMSAHGADLDSGRKKSCAKLVKFRSLHRVATQTISIDFPPDTPVTTSAVMRFQRIW